MREFPSLEGLYTQFKGRDFVVLAVNIGEAADAVRTYQTEHNLTIPVVVDRNWRVSNLYGVRGTPTRYLIDRQGRVIASSIGPRDWASREARMLIGHLLAVGKKPREG